MRTLSSVMCILAVGFAGACGDDASQSPDQLKQAVRESYLKSLAASGTTVSGGATSSSPVAPSAAAPNAPTSSHSVASAPASDPCAQHDFYADGECDDWCPTGDPSDCPAQRDKDPSNPGQACSAIFSPADGKCDASDPCSSVQDEDCIAGVAPVSPSPPTCPVDDGSITTPVACSAIASLPDGKCDASDPCSSVQDPDCASQVVPLVPTTAPSSDGVVVHPTPGVPPTGTTVSSTTASPPSGNPVGSTTAQSPCSVHPTPAQPPASDPPVACAAIGYLTNGVCEPPEGCEAGDPVDCHYDLSGKQ